MPAAQLPVTVSVTVSQKDIARIAKRLDRWQGKPLATRMDKALGRGMGLLVGPIRAAAPGPGNELDPEDATGNLRSSVVVRKLKKRNSLEVGAYAVGPTSARGRKGHHRHLVILGHRTANGSMTRANPFVSRAADPLEPRVLGFIDEQIRRLA